ncbi:MAG: two-component regulator propeller domain-containing protein, partial [Bacteroidota bacterium]
YLTYPPTYKPTYINTITTYQTFQPTNLLQKKASPKVDSILKFQSRVSIIFQDSQENYWFVAQEEGLVCFNGRHFTRYFDDDRLSGIRAIHETPNGHLWFGRENGVTVYDGHTFTVIESSGVSQALVDQIAHSSTSWEQEKTNFYYPAFDRNGVYRFDGQSLQRLTLPVPSDYPDFSQSENGYLSGQGYDLYAVYSVYQDPEGIFWFGTVGAGLFRYDGQSIHCVNEQSEKGVIRGIQKLENGRLWFGNNPSGFMAYDGKKLFNFSEHSAQPRNGLNDALSIDTDQLGNLWIGTFRSGLFYFDPSGDGAILKQFIAKDGLGVNNISTVYVDRSGQLWIGTGIGDVYIFNGEGFDPISVLH